MTSVGPEDAGATAASVDPGDAGAVDPRDAGSSDPGPTPVTPAYRAAPGRQHAVRWLSPTELARTAVVVLKGTIFAQYADKREVMSGVPEHVFAQSVSDEDMVIDYVADIGDGFEATYAVASSIARAREVVDRPTNVHSLVGAKTPDCACGDPDEAGRLLVLGGDEVYPYADVPQYKHRTLSVYRLAAALGRVPADAHALAIPGNHDWYDGLVAFRRIFCESWVTSEPLPRYAMSLPPRENLDTFAGAWATFQERSYYAVRLPHGWWLWGIDIQLAAPIDAEQLEYFRRARAHLEDDDRVIICTGKPGWTDAADRDDEARHSDRQILAWFVDRMFGNDEAKRRVRLLISGDKHYYARHSPERPDASFSPTLITCGGGGAYLSSTHHLQESIQPFTFDTPGYVSVPPLSEMPDHDPSRSWSLRERYPTRAQSENLRRGFWRIPFRNDRLPVLVAGIYVLLVWFAAVAQSRSAWPSPELLGWKVLDQASSGSAVPLVLTVALLTGLLTVYAKSTSKMTKKRAWALGGAHTLGHLVVAYTLMGLVGMLARELWDTETSWRHVLVRICVIVGSVGLAAVFGYVGAMVFAVYLRVCDGLASPVHDNEVFAGMRIEGYKSHLRIHMTRDELHVRVIGIDTVPERDTWVERSYERKDDDGNLLRHGTCWFPADPIASREVDRFVVTRDPSAPG